jgi:hypothetical protein
MLGFTLLVILVSAFGGTLRLIPDGLVVLAWAIAALAFFCWYSLRLRFVRVDEENLYVAKWFKEICIPLTEVDTVADMLGTGSLVVIRLKTSSAFGHKIVFIPTLGIFSIVLMLRPHPVVEELRNLITKASCQSSPAI